jgi:hypothetical protein
MVMSERSSLEHRIAALEVQIRTVMVGRLQLADVNTGGCTHGCTGACPDPTGNCTYGCTHGCTNGCTDGCGRVEERIQWQAKVK